MEQKLLDHISSPFFAVLMYYKHMFQITTQRLILRDLVDTDWKLIDFCFKKTGEIERSVRFYIQSDNI